MCILFDREDNYYSTGITMVAFINQYLAGEFSNLSGVHLMGDIIDPVQGVRDIKAFGLHTMIEG